MDSESKGVYVRVVMENLPTLAIARKAEAGPKGIGSGLRSQLVRSMHSNGTWRKAPS